MVIAGKGHEQGQEFEDGRKIPFDDRDVAREELRKLARRRRRLKTLDGERLASAAGAEVLAAGGSGGPARAVIDSREVREGDLFVGLPGERFDGGEFGVEALRRGAWGILVSTQWGRELAMQRDVGAAEGQAGWVLGAADPLASLQSLARAWHEQLGCPVVGITGSTGKTSVKDICRALLPGEIHASPENYNTEIGMPLAMLGAPDGTDVLVLEMGMRGPGQIAELCAIAEPDVAVITNVGPVHIELLGSIEAIAATKAEIIDGLRAGGTAVVPADPGRSSRTSRERRSCSGSGRRRRGGRRGDDRGGETDALVRTPVGEQRFSLPFSEAHNLDNALAAIAAGVALGFPLDRMAGLAPRIVFSRLRGELVELPENAILINDSYNANPISMRAALDHLATLDAGDGASPCSERCGSSAPRPRPTTARSASTHASVGSS